MAQEKVEISLKPTSVAEAIDYHRAVEEHISLHFNKRNSQDHL